MDINSLCLIKFWVLKTWKPKISKNLNRTFRTEDEGFIRTNKTSSINLLVSIHECPVCEWDTSKESNKYLTADMVHLQTKTRLKQVCCCIAVVHINNWLVNSLLFWINEIFKTLFFWVNDIYFFNNLFLWINDSFSHDFIFKNPVFLN